VERLLDATRGRPQRGPRPLRADVDVPARSPRLGACQLKLDQVDADSRVMHVHVSRLKRGLSTDHPLHGDELRVIAAWLNKRGRMKAPATVKTFFLSEQRKPLHRSSANLVLRRCSDAAALDLHAHPHMLRHACGFALEDQGADYPAHSGLLGA